MPTRYNTNYPRLKDADEFEELVRDICALEWNDPRTTRNGGSGQGQAGVDVYGQPANLDGVYYGVQCKLRPSQKHLKEKDVEDEVKKSREFPHQLGKLIIATDTPRNNRLQILIDTISEREGHNGGHKVEIWFWPDIERRIATHPSVLVKYYRDHLTSLTNVGILERLIDRPLQVLSIKPDSLDNIFLLELLLRFRGIRVERHSVSSTKEANHQDSLSDGVLCQVSEVADVEDPVRLQLLATLLGIIRSVDSSCPIFIISPSALEGWLKAQLHQYERPDRFVWLADHLPPAEIADHIFKKIFVYGYARRGTIPTINIAAGTASKRSTPLLLDLDWQSHLNLEQHPNPNEWNQLFLPAIKAVTTQLTSLKESTRIQIDSELPVPASVALGFYLNLRVALLGVWARQMGKRDTKQLWLSDGEPAQATVGETWFKKASDKSEVAIIELTCGISVHSAVEAYVKQHGLTVDVWLQAEVSIEQNKGGINEGTAIAFADHVGTLIRRLTAQGVADSHLFLRMPTALGVLIGQKLHACGRIHLYWFDNKSYSYKPAFVLA